ncbi:hypothetical protein [Ilumatobacter coccineus]|uniref:DUF732 domain-containing protein n=1 Tax=Ilumatobacter coccineus (strain NBRC 103263 / KCTC 29153 / YM16-304) TaxID=1313172 RepID=A0A6C7EF90_ILUCY|nr:hypothetical protein [Ilumatobacter coccineus]BAN03288.1 hypothetical protein YM304_29740 [Ilumatobacter coccineus YM16-304]
MTSSLRSSLVVLAAATLAVSACGGSDDGSSSSELSEADLALAAAVTADLDADDAEGFGQVFDTECMGRELVSALGGAEAADEKYGFNIDTASEMDDVPMEQADAERVVAGYKNCGDFDELLKQSFVAFGASEEDADCVLGELPDGLVAESVVVQLTDPTGSGENPIDAPLDAAAITCGVA